LKYIVGTEIFSSVDFHGGGKDVIGFGIDRATVTFGAGELEVHHIGGAQSQVGSALQISSLGGANGKGHSDSIRRTGDCL